MASKKQTEKDELVALLSDCRAVLKVPDPKQLAAQSKNLLQAANKLPTSLQTRPARSIMITAGAALLVAILLKPRLKRKKNKDINPNKPVAQQLLAFSLSITQPIARVWLSEKARQWLRK